MSMTPTKLDLDELCVTTMRTLAIDAIPQANSDHPGTPIAMSPTVLPVAEAAEIRSRRSHHPPSVGVVMRGRRSRSLA